MNPPYPLVIRWICALVMIVAGIYLLVKAASDARWIAAGVAAIFGGVGLVV